MDQESREIMPSFCDVGIAKERRFRRIAEKPKNRRKWAVQCRLAAYLTLVTEAKNRLECGTKLGRNVGVILKNHLE